MHYMKYIIHVASVPVQLACRHHASLISAGVYTNTGREGGAGRGACSVQPAIPKGWLSPSIKSPAKNLYKGTGKKGS